MALTITTTGFGPIDENTRSIGDIVVTDSVPGARLRYSISGADASLFTISRTGFLSFRAAPDFETPRDSGRNNAYDVVVRVSDGTTSDEQAFTVNVGNVSGVSIRAANGDKILPGDDPLTQSSSEEDTLIATDPGVRATLVGGRGNDVYFTDGDDRIIEKSGEGMDTVHASASHTLGANIENLELSGTAVSGTGNRLDNILTGNASDNTLEGGAGNDVLYGDSGNDMLDGGAGNDTFDGGAGNDILRGGAGNDVYYVDSADDLIEERAKGGIDTVFAFLVDVTLAANVENLVLIGTDATGTGNSLDNTLTADGDSNTLIGGAGNDVYIVDESGVVVDEAENEGIDTVRSSATSYTLGDNVENLVLTGAAGSGTGNGLANTITGNELANTLIGGAGNDRLFGGAGDDRLDGGTGVDIMTGAAGNDTYVVDNITDRIEEKRGAGTDTVEASVNYTLGAHLENLVLSGTAVTGTGNALANTITGNAAANTLSGGAGNDTLDGGAGADMLTGGAGNDAFVFATGESEDVTAASGTILTFANGVDVITDFHALVGAEADVFEIDGETFGVGSFATGAPSEGTRPVGNAIIVDGKFQSQIAGDPALDLWYVSGVWDAENRTFDDTPDGPDFVVFSADLSGGPVSAVGIEGVVLDDPTFVA